MSVDSAEQPSQSSERFDRASVRLFAALERSCDPRLAFAEQVESSLAAAIGLLAFEPELRHLLGSVDYRDRALACRHEAMAEALADMLRAAARRSVEALEHPPFLESFLISGICSVLSRRSAADDQLLRDLLEYVLANYLSPDAAGAYLRGCADRALLDETKDSDR